ncbi:MAG: hypothetical protein R3A52_27240 [Polyangiales bacterium]
MLHVRSYWDEEDIDFYWEIDDEGWTVRHVAIVRATGFVQGAASLDEWNAAREAGTLDAYIDRYGRVAEGNVNTWDPDWPHDEITAEAYEAVWRDARATLDARHHDG